MAVDKPSHFDQCRLLVSLTWIIWVFSSIQVVNAKTFEFDDEQSISLGMRLRTSLSSAETISNGNRVRETDGNLDSFRLLINGSLNRNIKGTFATEKDADNHIKVLDAFAQLELSPEFNIWGGRLLPASDRSNLAGPYNLSTWFFPSLASRYPTKFSGRNNGVTFWGRTLEDRLVYSVGGYEGHNGVKGASNEDNNLSYSFRLQYDFWSKNLDSGYLTRNVYENKDVFSIGFVGMYQEDGVGTSLDKGNYRAWNIDGLLEKQTSIGAVIVEGAYYIYDTNDTIDVSANKLATINSASNVGRIVQSKSYLLGSSLMLPQTIGWGKIQPFIRYQKLMPDFPNLNEKHQLDYGLHYNLDNYKARFSLSYTRNTEQHTKDLEKLIFGLQFQM